MWRHCFKVFADNYKYVFLFLFSLLEQEQYNLDSINKYKICQKGDARKTRTVEVIAYSRS